MDRKSKQIFSLLVIILVTSLIIGMFWGTSYIPPREVFSNEINKQIVFELRTPRMIAALISGMTLAASGLLIQNSMRNQLADSSILGFQSGATLMALLIMLAVPSLYPILPLISFCGGLIVYIIIILISRQNSSSLFIVVSGIAISAVVRSMISLVTLLFADNFENTVSWTNGSLNSVSQVDAALMLFYGTLLLVVTIMIIGKLDLLLLDDEYLTNLGVNTTKMRIGATLLAILLTSVSVSFVGTIGFVGLLAPHITRRLVVNTSANLMPISIVLGGVLVLGCDTLQRLLIPIYEIPVGTIMSLFGGIYLVYLLVRSQDVRVS